MNKTFIWILVAVVVIGGGWYFSSSRDAVPADETTAVGDTVETSTVTGGTSGSGTTAPKPVSSARTLSALLSRGGSYKCTFSKVTAAGRTDGAVYVSGNRLRGDYMTSFSAGAKAESHILFLAGMLYAWTPPVQLGYKAPATAATVGTALGSSGSAGFDYGQALDYSCQQWGGDATLFEFPKGFTFSNV